MHWATKTSLRVFFYHSYSMAYVTAAIILHIIVLLHYTASGSDPYT